MRNCRHLLVLATVSLIGCATAVPSGGVGEVESRNGINVSVDTSAVPSADVSIQSVRSGARIRIESDRDLKVVITPAE